MRLITAVMLVVYCLLSAPSLPGRSRRHRDNARSGSSFDFYLLTLSYAPDFCDQPNSRKDPLECGTGRKLSFVVHGLWPQSEAGKGPMNCGSSPVSQSIVQLMLNYIPTPGLIQHEWSTHGSCTGLSAADYFALVRKARDSVKIPGDVARLKNTFTSTPPKLDSDFVQANPSFPRDSFRSTCYPNAELQEMRICLTKDLAGRACPATVIECSRPSITLLPVR